MSYRPARLRRLAGRYDNFMPESTKVYPPFGDKAFATALYIKMSACRYCLIKK